MVPENLGAGRPGRGTAGPVLHQLCGAPRSRGLLPSSAWHMCSQHALRRPEKGVQCDVCCLLGGGGRQQGKERASGDSRCPGSPVQYGPSRNQTDDPDVATWI